MPGQIGDVLDDLLHYHLVEGAEAASSIAPGALATLSGGALVVRTDLGGVTVNRARVTLSWPLENTGASLPNLMATVAGNLFELQQFSGLRIEDIRLPDAFISAYPGPQFGVDGVGVDRQPGGKAVNDGQHRFAVRFASGPSPKASSPFSACAFASAPNEPPKASSTWANRGMAIRPTGRTLRRRGLL